MEKFFIFCALGVLSIQTVQGERIGCYKENKRNRNFCVSPGGYNPSSITPNGCAVACSNFDYEYLAIAQGKYCFCAHVLELTITNDTQCDRTCEGGFECGGTDYVSVYRVGGFISDLSLSVSNPVVSVSQQVDFTITITSELQVKYKLDYGDGAGFTPENHTDMYFKTFENPGEYDVVLVASDAGGSGQELEASAAVVVHEAVGKVEIQCPEADVTFNELECNATVLAGTSMMATVDFGDTVVETFSIPDVGKFYGGPAVPDKSAPPAGSGGTVIMPASDFREDGILTAFEFYAASGTGTVNFLILEPQCSGCYSYKDNTCQASNCPDPNLVECTIDNFCPSAGLCSPGCSPVTRYSNTNPQVNAYTVVASLTHSVLSDGYGVYRLTPDKQVEIKKGYILGFESTAVTLGAIVAETGKSDFTTSDATNKGNTVTSFTQTAPNRHLLRGVVNQPVSIKLRHSYNTNGLFTVELKVENTGISTTPQIASSNISIGNGIDDIILNTSACFETSQNVQVEIMPHAGDDVTYTWDWGDMSTHVIGPELLQTHKYSAPGRYNVTVIATNPTSQRTNTTEVCVEDSLTNLQISSVPSATGDPANFTFSVASGSDYTCNWTTDGDTFTTNSVDTPSNSVTQYTYSSPGDKSIDVECHNMVSRITQQINHVVEDAVTGLTLNTRGAVKEEDFTLEWTITTGTNPLFNVTIGSLNPNSTYDTASRTGTSSVINLDDTGLIPVRIHAKNRVSEMTIEENLTVEVRISGVVFTCSRTQVAMTHSVTFGVTMQDGSGVQIHVDYDDAGNTDNHSLPSGMTWVAGDVQKFHHIFSTGGRKNVTLVVSNNIEPNEVRSCLIDVIAPVGNIDFKSNSPVKFSPPGKAEIWFELSSGSPPTLSQVEIDFGDGSKEIHEFQIGKVYEHEYVNDDRYNLEATVSNSVGSNMVFGSIDVVEPVVDLVVTASPSHASLGQPVELTATMYRGCGSGVQLHWDFGDTNTQQVAESGTCPEGSTTVTHTYSGIQSYTVTVRAENLLGDTSASYEIWSQVPVKGHLFSTVVTGSDNWAGVNVVKTFTISFSGNPSELPTDARMILDFGDDTVTDDPLPSTFPHMVTHTYTAPAHYIVKLTIENLASSHEYEMEAGVYEPITGLAVDMKYIPGLPVGATPSPGKGPDNNIFPLDRPVTFDVTMTQGTVVKYSFSAVSPSETITQEFNSSPFDVKFDTVEDYVITIHAQNPREDIPVPNTKPVLMRARSTGLEVTDRRIVTPSGGNKSFDLTLDTVGSSACLEVDYGDGELVETFGDEATCKVPGKRYVSQFSSFTRIYHLFLEVGTFTMTASVSNVVSEVSTQFTFPVSYVACKSPAIDIHDRRVAFYDPMKVKRSTITRVIGTTDLNCTQTFENTKSWMVWELNRQTGNEIRAIDVTSLESSVKAELAIPAQFLDYGLYKVTYRVEMDSSKFPDVALFSSESSTYIEVTKTDLIGSMIEGGMSMIRVKHGEMLTLDPGTYSRDPDVPEDQPQVFDNFTWFCMKKGDRGFPKLPDGSYNMSFSSIPLTDPNAYSEDLGGCFRQGPGPIGFTTKTVSINTVNFDVGAKYLFMVVVTKDTRSTQAELWVDVTDKDIPSVIIECKTKDLCQQVQGGQKVNPSARLALMGRCKGACTGEVSYRWQGYSYDYKWPYKPIPDFQNYTWGVGSPEIAIEKRLFEEFPSVDRFRIDLTVWEAGGEPGLSQIIVFVNQPPYGGSCTLTGNSGQVLSNSKTTLSCNGWKDDDQITVYQFYVLFKNDDMERHLVFGEDSEVQVELPLGPDWDDFWMDVYVRIYDSHNAYQTVKIDTVQVRPATTDLKQWVNNLLTGKDDEISLTVARADLLESSYTFQSLASTLNSASKGSVQEYQNTSVSAAETPTGFGPEGAPKKHQDSVDPELEKAAKEEKDNRAQLREQMISGIKKLTTSNVASVALKASTVTTLAAYPDELTRQAQEDMMSILVDCSQTLFDLKNRTTKEELVAAATNVLAGAGTLLVAAKYHYKDPLLSDLSAARELDEYDTNRESTDEAIVSLDPEEGRAQLTMSTNKNLQKRTADDVVSKIVEGVKKVAEAVRSYLVPGEVPVEIVTDQMALTLAKNQASQLANRTIDDGRGSVTLPDWCTLQADPDCSSDEIINLEIIKTPSVPYGLTDNAVNLTFSNAVEINFVREDGSHVGISGSQEDIEIVIPRDAATVTGDPMEAKPSIAPRNNEYLFYHRSSLEAKGSSIHVQFRPHNVSVQYLVFVRFDDFPNITLGKWDAMQLIPRSMSQAGTYGSDDHPDPYTLFISNAKVPANWLGDFYVGVRQLEPAEYDMYGTGTNVTGTTWTGGVSTFTGNYSIRIYTSSCVYYDEQRQDWLTDGCKVGELTSLSQTQCFCNHLTTFAGSLIVAPNAIDWNFVFANADFLKNPTLYITEIVIGVIYILAMIWARRRDKKDVEDVGITPLPDNDAQDKYYYEIVVQTGLRSNAGTDSKVHFILSGEYEETDVRPLSDPKRKILRRGATDGFLLAVPRPLGPLNFVRIWHDNSGKGKFASWYLKYFLVRDLQTGEKFYFICNKWFAVEEGDGQVDRVCPVAGPEQMMQFGHQFSQKTRRNLSDGHLWFSVVARPPRSRFTRVQRVSCCLSLLFLTMLANAMWYNRAPAATGSNSFTFGPFALTPAELFIGVVTNLIVFPISFIIIQLFRKSRPRKKRRSRIQEAIQKSGVKLSDINPQMGSKWSLQQPQEELNLPDRDNPEYRDDPTPRPGTAVSTVSRSDTAMSGRVTNSYYNMQKKKRDKAKTKRMLPWWCQIIAWILLWASVIVSVAFVTFYGISFGDYKCKQWITSMLIAFVMSIFVTQPIKVFLTAVVLSLIIRNPGEDDDEGDEDEEDPYLAPDEEYLHRMPAEGYGRPKKVAYKPPDPHTLEKARLIRLKEIEMWNVIREIVFYAFFLWVLMVISYGNRDPLSYLYKYSLERNFIGNNITSSDFRQVHNTKNFWNWTTNSLVPSIRANVYYNDDPPLYLRGYINDKVSRIMGYATMRQLRISRGTCRMEEVFKEIIESCNGDYLFWNEEKGSYGTSWTDLNGTDPPSHYVYRDAESLNGYPYWGRLAIYNGGGYVVELRESLSDLLFKMKQLENEGWIDKFTRAVFIEFTVYNPGINLFAVATLLAEWHPSAGVIASYRFEPVRLFSYMQSAILFQIACEVAFLLFILFFIYREVKCIIKEKGKYLHNFWNMVEISIIGVSIGGVVIYFYRLIVSKQLTNIFKKSHGNEYMKFQYIGYWNEILSYLIGWLVFLATLKFLKLLRFNRRMSMLAATLRNGWKSMFHFGIIFTIVFLAFIQLFYLVYHTNIYIFANFINSMEAGFLMMMGKFDIYSMMMMEPLITPVFFFLFVLTITFILVNMFVSILNESFSSVKHDITKQPNEYEIVDFMLGRFKQWTGLGGAAPPTSKSEDILLNNLKKGDNGNGKAPLEHFPDKVDKLLNTISKAYFDQDNLENVLGPKTDADRLAMKNLLKKHAEQTSNRPLSATPTDKVASFDSSTGQYRRF